MAGARCQTPRCPIMPLQAAGWQPNSFETEGATPLAYLAANIEAYIDSGPDAIGKSILGSPVNGADPTFFSNIDLSQRLMDTFSETDRVIPWQPKIPGIKHLLFLIE